MGDFRYSHDMPFSQRTDIIRKSASDGTFEQRAYHSHNNRHIQEAHALSKKELAQRFLEKLYDKRNPTVVTVSTFLNQSRIDALRANAFQNAAEIAHWDKNKPNQDSLIITEDLSPKQSEQTLAFKYTASDGKIAAQRSTQSILVLEHSDIESDIEFPFRIKTFYNEPDENQHETIPIDLVPIFESTDYFQQILYPLEQAFIRTATSPDTPAVPITIQPFNDTIEINFGNITLSIHEPSDNELEIGLQKPRQREKTNINPNELKDWLETQKAKYPEQAEYVAILLDNFEWSPTIDHPKFHTTQSTPNDVLPGLKPTSTETGDLHDYCNNPPRTAILREGPF